MNKNIRTDLALEAQEALTKQTRQPIQGLAVETIDEENWLLTRVQVKSDEAEQQVGKPKGNYVTLEVPGLRYKNTPLQDQVMACLTKELAKMMNLPKNATVLVVGLGNWNVTPDALGPKVVDRIVVTRHIEPFLTPELRGKVRRVCALAPGVLGLTGMETSEIIEGVVRQIKPDLVIAIDALAAAASRRVTTTIQITDTGIHPGSGVGNRRKALNQTTLGVPLLAIGVPTVVHASTIAMDTLDTLKEHAAFSRYFKSLASLSPQDEKVIVRQVMPQTLGDLMVTPKEVDRLIEDVAVVVAGAINAALHEGLDYHNIHKYLHS